MTTDTLETPDGLGTRLSSVRIVTSTRGYDISVHAYAGCSREVLDAAGDLAMAEYIRVFLDMKGRIEAALKGVVA